DPVEAYQSLIHSMQKAELKTAYLGLSSATRKDVEARSRQLSELSDGGVKDDPVALFFTQIERPTSLADITLERREGDQAMLKVSSTSGKTVLVRMVREDTAWKLDLTDSLK